MLTPGKVIVIMSCSLELTLIPWDRSVAVCDLAAYAKVLLELQASLWAPGQIKEAGKVLTWLTGLIRPGVRWHGSDTRQLENTEVGEKFKIKDIKQNKGTEKECTDRGD